MHYLENIVNTIVFEQIKDLFENEAEFNNTLEKLVQKIDSVQPVINEAFELSDHTKIREFAHALKSPASFLGFSPLAEICLKIETLGNNLILPSVQLIEQFNLACRETKSYLLKQTKQL